MVDPEVFGHGMTPGNKDLSDEAIEASPDIGGVLLPII